MNDCEAPPNSSPRPGTNEEGTLMEVLQWDDFDKRDLLLKRWVSKVHAVMVSYHRLEIEGEVREEMG